MMRINTQPTKTQADPLSPLAEALLPNLLACHSSLDAVHRHAVELLNSGQPCKALHLFSLVHDHPQVPSGLAAWAWFKEGELHQQEGRAHEAERFFRRTLEHNPGHAKARLALHRAEQPLRVILGQRQGWQPAGHALDFDFNDPALWSYYLGARPADEIWLAPPRRMLEFEPVTIRLVAERHLAPGGVVIIGVAPDRLTRLGREELADLAGQGAQTFREAMDRIFSALAA